MRVVCLMNMMTDSRFVADIGGTHIRLAVANGLSLSHVERYRCADFDSLTTAISHYFSRYPELRFTQGCLALASYMGKDQVDMINHSWSFSLSDVARSLSLDSLIAINDFTAVAFCLPFLTSEQTIQIGGGQAQPKQTMTVCGPGTGLGVGHLVYHHDQWIPIDGEGGHVDFAPVNDAGRQVLHFIEGKLGRVSAEDVLSGRGLVHIYQSLVHQHNQQTGIEHSSEYQTPEAITRAALFQECELCEQTLNVFCQCLGAFAGNLALTVGAFGGVYISGGVVHHFKSLFLNSDFRAYFENKPPLKNYLRAIPTYLIDAPEHALLGAAAYLNQYN